MIRRSHQISGDFAHTSLVEPRPRVELGTYALRIRSTLLKKTVHYQGLCTPGRSGGCRCPAPVPRRLSLSPLFITGRLARNQKAETARFLHACTVVTSGTRRDNRKDKLMANFLTLQEVCDRLQVTRSTIDKWRATGRAPQFRKLPNGSLRCESVAFEDWLEDLPEVA